MHPPHPRFVVFALVCALLALCIAVPGFAEEPSVDPLTVAPVDPPSAAPPTVEPDVVAARHRIDAFADKMDAKLEQQVETLLGRLTDAHYEAEGQWMAQHYFALATIKRGAPASPARYASEVP
jgi:hypothetical protein